MIDEEFKDGRMTLSVSDDEMGYMYFTLYVGNHPLGDMVINHEQRTDLGRLLLAPTQDKASENEL